MAQMKALKETSPMKLAGGFVLLCGSVGLLIARFPHREYVAVHADAPRAVKPKAPPAAPPAAPAAATPAPAKAPEVSSTGLHSPPQTAAAAAQPSAEGVSPDAPPVEEAVDPDAWQDDCLPEIGLLCHDVPDGKVLRCLEGYGDGVLRPCRRALNARRVYRRRKLESKSESQP